MVIPAVKLLLLLLTVQFSLAIEQVRNSWRRDASHEVPRDAAEESTEEDYAEPTYAQPTYSQPTYSQDYAEPTYSEDNFEDSSGVEEESLAEESLQAAPQFFRREPSTQPTRPYSRQSWFVPANASPEKAEAVAEERRSPDNSQQISEVAHELRSVREVLTARLQKLETVGGEVANLSKSVRDALATRSVRSPANVSEAMANLSNTVKDVLVTRLDRMERLQQELNFEQQRLKAAELQHEVDELRRQTPAPQTTVVATTTLQIQDDTPDTPNSSTSAASASSTSKGETEGGAPARDSTGLPHWAVMLIGASGATILLCTFVKVGESCCSPAPGELAGGDYRAEMLVRTGDLDHYVAEQAQQVMDSNMALLAQAQRAKETLQRGLHDAKSQLQEHLMAQSQVLIQQVKAALDPDSPVAAASGADLRDLLSVENVRKLAPMFGLIVTGSFAPPRIKAMEASCNASLVKNGIILAVCAGVGAADRDSQCAVLALWVWIIGISSMSLLACLMSIIVKGKCATALASLEHQMTLIKPSNTGIPLMDALHSLRNSGGYYMKAMVAYDQIIESSAYTWGQLTFGIYMLIGAIAVYLSNYRNSDLVMTCQADHILGFLHVFSFLYILLFTYSMFGLFVWAIGLCIGGKNSLITKAIIAIAREMDNANPGKLPIFLTLVGSFVLRDGSNVYKAQAEFLSMELEYLQEMLNELNAHIGEIRNEKDEMEASARATGHSEDALVKHFEEKMGRQIDALRPLALLSAPPGRVPQGRAQSSNEGAAASSNDYPGSSSSSSRR